MHCCFINIPAVIDIALLCMNPSMVHDYVATDVQLHN